MNLPKCPGAIPKGRIGTISGQIRVIVAFFNLSLVRFNYMKPFLFLFSILLLSSCDAFVSLSYVVENKTSRPLNVFVPGYHADGHHFSRGVDTVLEVPPHDFRRVGATFPRVTGPIGAGKRIYREQPAYCGLKLIKADTTIIAGCTKRAWKFRRGVSVLKIRR